MTRLTLCAAFAAALLATSTVQASPTIVNLSAGPTNPNAGPSTVTASSGGYTYNPVTLILGQGTYSVSVVGIAGGGLYDAYAVYAPSTNPPNGAYTDGYWSVNSGGVIQVQPNPPAGPRFNTAAQALAYYSALTPITFTVASNNTSVAFYLDDTAYPYFADDSGGISLGITQVPEPMSLALLGSGLGVLGLIRRRRNAA